jgi:hypothetical protein
MLEDLLEADDQLDEFRRQKFAERDAKLKELDDLIAGFGKDMMQN